MIPFLIKLIMSIKVLNLNNSFSQFNFFFRLLLFNSDVDLLSGLSLNLITAVSAYYNAAF
jgi:hypothetical protein